jgi:SAM-dependent methyltransferase
VGSVGDSPCESFERIGREVRAEVLELLPPSWSFEGKRVLDFGCGAGRVLRQFAAEGQVATMKGCDIDGPSIEWLNENLSPPFSAVRNDEKPPLPWGDGSFDLIWAFSVFTHITDQWSAWLCELHRLLDRDGLLIATFLGSGMSEQIAREAWDESRIGMNVLNGSQSWDEGGPLVLQSPWWIREHWGRAFVVETLRPTGFGQSADVDAGQGVVLLRKQEGRITPSELERVATDDPREVRALRHNIVQLQRESALFRRAAEQAGALASSYERSLSWRLTRPLRRVRRLLGRLLDR